MKKTETDTAYIETLEKEYGLSGLEFVGVSEKGVSSYNTIFETPDGRRFFVKQYKEDDAERRENSNLVERHVSTHSSVPTVLPLETARGTSQIYVNGKMYAVFAFQEHNVNLPVNDAEKQKQTFSLAETLSSIHSTTTDGLDDRVGVIERWNPGEITDQIAHLEMIESKINEKDSFDDFDEKALRVIGERKKILLALDINESVSKSDAICHGDYHSQNVLFDDDFNVTGVIDWDICAKSDPYIDFLNTFKMTVIGRKYDTYKQERCEIARSFIKGYLAGLNIDFDKDRLRNAATILTQVIAGSSWPLDEHYFMDYTKADAHLEKELEKAKFFSEGADEIVEFIMSIMDELEQTS